MKPQFLLLLLLFIIVCPLVNSLNLYKIDDYFQTDKLGGSGGSGFTDIGSFIDQKSLIEKINIRHGNKIDAIQVVYRNTNTQPKLHGNSSGGSLNTFTLDKDEYIVEVSGSYNSTVFSLSFLTNKNKKSTLFGKDVPKKEKAKNVKRFTFRISDYKNTIGNDWQQYHIGGFYGNSNKLLDSIGFYLYKIPQAQPTPTPTIAPLSWTEYEQGSVVNALFQQENGMKIWGKVGASGDILRYERRSTFHCIAEMKKNIQDTAGVYFSYYEKFVPQDNINAGYLKMTFELNGLIDIYSPEVSGFSLGKTLGYLKVWAGHVKEMRDLNYTIKDFTKGKDRWIYRWSNDEGNPMMRVAGEAIYGEIEGQVEEEMIQQIQNVAKDYIRKFGEGEGLRRAGDFAQGKFGKWCKNLVMSGKLTKVLKGASMVIGFAVDNYKNISQAAQVETVLKGKQIEVTVPVYGLQKNKNYYFFYTVYANIASVGLFNIIAYDFGAQYKPELVPVNKRGVNIVNIQLYKVR